MTEPMTTGGAGLLLGLMLTYFWKQMPWSKSYLTRKECTNCSLHNEIIVVKAVVLDLAVASGLPTEKYKDLVK